MLQELGLEISQSKLVSPTNCAICLGIEINTVNRTLKIPQEKLTDIQNICSQFASKSKVTKNQLQSLSGSLLYITKCFKPARFFLNRMLQLLRDSNSQSIIELNDHFHRDLNWFNTFLWQYNVVTFYDHRKPSYTIYLDACLTGFRAHFANMVYALPIPLAYKNYTIVHLEILRIVVALKIWEDHWLLTSLFNIQLMVNHIPGIHNKTADLLSRWQDTDAQFKALSNLVPYYEWMHLDHTHLNQNV